MTQTDLANTLGMSFQQVQKYENGVNRISASRLFELSLLFDLPVEYFFEDMPHGRFTEGLDTPDLVEAKALLDELN